MKNNFLFIITARAGSKRLPKKNTKIFNGKPLILWTISQALRFSDKNKVVLTTDDTEAIKIAKKYKSIEIVIRPKHLSHSSSSSIDVIKHVLKIFKEPENFILLQPTSPLRNDLDIKKAMLLINKGKKAVMSQSEVQYDSSKINLNNSLAYYKPLSSKSEKIFAPNGAVYAATRDWLSKNKTFYSKSVFTFDMPAKRSIDIDYDYQFFMAETIFKKFK